MKMYIVECVNKDCNKRYRKMSTKEKRGLCPDCQTVKRKDGNNVKIGAVNQQKSFLKRLKKVEDRVEDVMTNTDMYLEAIQAELIQLVETRCGEIKTALLEDMNKKVEDKYVPRENYKRHDKEPEPPKNIVRIGSYVLGERAIKSHEKRLKIIGEILVDAPTPLTTSQITWLMGKTTNDDFKGATKETILVTLKYGVKIGFLTMKGKRERPSFQLNTTWEEQL